MATRDELVAFVLYERQSDGSLKLAVAAVSLDGDPR
jgi:hypothetical protein